MSCSLLVGPTTAAESSWSIRPRGRTAWISRFEPLTRPDRTMIIRVFDAFNQRGSQAQGNSLGRTHDGIARGKTAESQQFDLANSSAG